MFSEVYHPVLLFLFTAGYKIFLISSFAHKTLKQTQKERMWNWSIYSMRLREVLIFLIFLLKLNTHVVIRGWGRALTLPYEWQQSDIQARCGRQRAEYEKQEREGVSIGKAVIWLVVGARGFLPSPRFPSPRKILHFTYSPRGVQMMPRDLQLSWWFCVKYFFVP